ncbi:MAG TPA: alpha/beta fold hydrolase [Chryseolinea sp.]
MSTSAINVSFMSGNDMCAGHLYLPQTINKKAPCVVMANGFSGTMDWILPDFADHFVAAGFAVLTFDYRYLGASAGMPRQLIIPRRQRTDLKNAIEYVNKIKEIDSDRLVLWGTSLGGSNVVNVAAENKSIAGVILLMPAIDAIRGSNQKEKTKKMRYSGSVAWATLRLAGAAILDVSRRALGFKPYYIDVFGQPGKAVFADQELAPLFDALQNSSKLWKNKVAAGSLLTLPTYRKGTIAKITAPIQVCLARHDVEISNQYVKDKIKEARNARVFEYDCGHFELYHPPYVDKLVEDQVAFLKSIF